MADAAVPSAAAAPGRRATRMLLRDPSSRVGLSLIALVAFAAIFAPMLTPFEPTQQSIADALQGPSTRHWFGTDEFGRDVLTRILYGARPAIIVGLLSVVVSVTIGAPLGMLAGFVGGVVDRTISSVVDVMLSFPALLLALMVIALLGSSLTVLVVALGIAHVPLFVRLARSSTMIVRELDYVAASRTFGAPGWRILSQHVAPNVVGPIIVMATLGVAGAIREEAALSFLGLGVQPPQPSWGNLIRDGVGVILEAPWLAVIPGLCLTASVLAVNMVGDAVRDALDPRDIARSAPENRRKT